ncbi:two-component system sensor histidine kinase YesM [Paenibacillus sp. V4I3]|uniref:sensor histidine kinase n=1 Tax=Paenibacillus sp. V4I3 TaxID=3042305 RepID=UPI0027871832|nr:sensor histidine kinase [Paenibacillus sp. V4I3]MDQ0878638.1 two-component system sensor histidine kinase YesM [Paenibacillus sp. V4I3]
MTLQEGRCAGVNNLIGKKPLQINLQTKLFATFFILLVFILGCFLIYVNVLVVKPLKERTIQDTLLTATKVASQLDSYIAMQNQLSQRVLSNRDIFSFLYESLNKKSTYTIDDLNQKRVLSDIMFRAVGPSLNIHDMIIYSLQGDELASYIGYTDLPTLGPVLSNDTTRRKLESSSYILYAPKDQPISFIRSIVDVNGTVFGYLSIQMDNRDLQSLADAGNIGNVYITDGNGEAVIKSSNMEYKIPDGSNDKLSNTNGIYKDTSDNYVAFQKSSFTGWTVYVITPSKSVLGSVNSVKNIAIIIIVSLTLFSFLYIYFTSKSLVLPIRKLRSQILRINYSNLSMNMDSRLYNNELLLLNEAFRELFDRLQESIEREKMAVHKEAMARNSALQAQIAPHFIHNVLYLISIAAQENKNQIVSEMCKHLSENLRYVVSSPYEHVTLLDEIEHTKHYLSLIGQQYEDDLIWEIDIDHSSESILLPRLVIQPFVENCIEHAFDRSDPPWKIQIKAKLYNGLWAIEITDNGGGFEESKIKEILRNIDDMNPDSQEQESLAAGIGNMGIVNTVNRLKLMYRNRLFFNLYNNSGSQGATIQVIASLTRDFY